MIQWKKSYYNEMLERFRTDILEAMDQSMADIEMFDGQIKLPLNCKGANLADLSRLFRMIDFQFDLNLERAGVEVVADEDYDSDQYDKADQKWNSQ